MPVDPLDFGLGDYQINANEILSPTEFRWMPRRPLDVQGDNRPIYPAVRSAQLKWRLMTNEEWSDLQDNFRSIEASGTSVVRIPEFPTATGQAYAFREYSGTTLAEPTIGPYFEGYPKSVVLVIHNIVVE